MNHLVIIGNLTRDPEKRVTSAGKDVTSFTVAVNRRNRDEVDYFRVSAWEGNARACAQYLRKGSKVAVIGSVSCSAYSGNDGKPHASLEVFAAEVQFLSGRQQESAPADPVEKDEASGFEKVETDDLPF